MFALSPPIVCPCKRVHEMPLPLLLLPLPAHCVVFVPWSSCVHTERTSF